MNNLIEIRSFEALSDWFSYAPIWAQVVLGFGALGILVFLYIILKAMLSDNEI